MGEQEIKIETCKDCLHYEAHKHFFKSDDYQKSFDDYFNDKHIENKCPEFANRSEWVHLPCVAMVEQFIKDGKFDRRKTAHNGRIAVVYIDKKKWNSPLIDITEQFYNTDKAQERIKALEEK